MCHDRHDHGPDRFRDDWPGRPLDPRRDDGPERHRDRGPDDCGCDCGCHDGDGPGPGFERRFVSRAETLEALEWYLQELLNEAQGVREAIADLRKQMAAAEAPVAPPAPEAPPPRRGRRRKA